MKKKITFGTVVKIASAVVIAALCILVGYLLFRLTDDKEAFEAFLMRYGNMSRVIYIMIVALQVLLALIPGEPLEIAGGYIFGAWEGTLLNLIGATLGSVIVFLLVRKFGKKLVTAVFSEEKLQKIRFLQSSKKRDILLMIIFVLPGTPKDLLCYFAGLTDIKIPVWLIICSLGRIPAVVTSAIGGSAIETERYLLAVIAFAVSVAISLGGILIYHFICTKNEKQT